MFDEHKRPPVNVSLTNYNRSMNFFWGISYDGQSEDFDSLNNPYVEFRGHQMTNGLEIDNVHELEHCD